MPKVSIIVPVYNVEKYLSKCLDTLVNQTLDDYEVIVVNDGSPDNSQVIIDKYAKDYPNIIKPYKKQNGGLSDARNLGMQKATGEYIGFVDSDDFVDLTMFEQLYNRAVKTNADIVVCGHTAVTIDQDGNLKDSNYKPVENAEKFGKSIYESSAILAYSKSFAWNKIYAKEILKDYRFPAGQIFEDSAVVYNILSSAKKVEVVNSPLYFYVTERQGAITNTVTYRIFDIFKSCESLISHYKKIGKFEDLKSEIESLCLLHIQTRFTSLRKKGSFKLKFKYIDRAFDFLETHFPYWRNNKYYLERRSALLNAHPSSPYIKARESRKGLKKYYIMYSLRSLPLKILGKQ